MSFALWSLAPLFIGLGVIVLAGIIVGLCLYDEFTFRDAAYIAYWERRESSCR